MSGWRGTGWQDYHKRMTRASLNPIPPAFGGGGYIHVPGQTGMYGEYLAHGGPPEGIGSMNILAGGKMAAYRAGVRVAGSPIRAPTTYTRDPSTGQGIFVPTMSLKGGEAYMPLSDSFFGTASLPAGASVAGGGTALAHGASSLGLAGGGEGALAGIGGNISDVTGGIMNTIVSFIPLAIKIIIVVIILKIVFGLLRGK